MVTRKLTHVEPPFTTILRVTVTVQPGETDIMVWQDDCLLLRVRSGVPIEATLECIADIVRERVRLAFFGELVVSVPPGVE